jgi:hypothetical protein
MEKARGKTRISGMVVGGNLRGLGSANIKIRIIGKNKTYTAITDKNGFYEIYGLPAGEYFIEPEIPKGLRIIDLMLRLSSSYDENRHKSKIEFLSL